MKCIYCGQHLDGEYLEIDTMHYCIPCGNALLHKHHFLDHEVKTAPKQLDNLEQQ